MSVKQENGSWVVHLKLRDSNTGKIVWRKKRGFATKREAKAAEAEMRKETANRRNISFLDIMHQMESYQDCSVTVKCKHNAIVHYRAYDLANRPIDKITRAELLNWRRKLSEMQFSTCTKNEAIQLIRSTFRFASEIYAYQNHGIILKRFKMTKEEEMHEMAVWTPEQFQQFLNAIPSSEHVYYVYFEMLFWTGLRRGEGIALQVNDLSDDGMLYVHASQRNRTEGRKTTKTRQNRRIAVDSSMLQNLLEIKKHSEGPYLFGGAEPLAPTTIDRVFRIATKAAGLPRIRLHDLRHSHATWLINNNVNIVAVSKRLGHANIEQTLKTYTHLLGESNEQLLDKLNEKHKKVAQKLPK